MSRGRSIVTRRDLERAVKAAQAAGLEVTGVEIDRRAGTFRVLTARPGAATQSPDEFKAWVDAHAGHA